MQVKKRGFGIRGISFIKLELRRVADQLGLKSSRPPVQVDPGSTWPVVFLSVQLLTCICILIQFGFCIIFWAKSNIIIKNY